VVGIKTLDHIINASILIFVMSAANSDLYIGSRTLYGLAVEGKAPRIFMRVNRMGVPYPALILCSAFCALVFLNVSSSGAKGAKLSCIIDHPHLNYLQCLPGQPH
jgi:amino acid transporter